MTKVPIEPQPLSPPLRRCCCVGARMAAGAASPGGAWEPREVLCLNGHQGGVIALAINREGTLLVSAAADGELRAWSPSTGAPLGVWRGHTRTVWAVAFSLDGAFVYSASADRSARVWRASDGACEAVLEAAHLKDVLCLAAEEAPLGGWALATGGADGALHCWSAAVAPRSPTSAALAAVTHVPLAVSSGAAPVASARGAHAGPVRCLARAAAAALLLTGGGDGVVLVWSRDGPCGDLREVSRLEAAGGARGVAALVLRSQGGPRPRTLVYAAHEDGAVRCWDAGAGAPLALLTWHSAAVRALSLSKDGDTLWTAAADGRAAAWRASRPGAGALDAARAQPLELGSDGAAFTPLRCAVLVEPPAGADAAFYAGGLDAQLRRWRASDGECTAVMGGHDGAVTALVASRRGGALFSGGADATVRVWALKAPPPRAAGCVGAFRETNARVAAELRGAVAGAAHAALRAVAPLPPGARVGAGAPGPAAALRTMLARASLSSQEQRVHRDADAAAGAVAAREREEDWLRQQARDTV